MTTTIEQQQQEAIRRLKMLEEKGLHPNVCKEFSAEGKLNYSERMNLGARNEPAGILYWISNQPEFEALIRDFEEKNHALVYHATFERTGFGTLLDLFQVGCEQEEWEEDCEDLRDDYAFVYTINLTVPNYSEFGTIGFKVSGGGLVRSL